ncbi:MAG: bifunctional [glutamine synthetase] adenylyltransferase/[glutamine synthetase]-adenylyl-L-tyrosine phosphorylase [Alphaproteobacteria bacterium]
MFNHNIKQFPKVFNDSLCELYWAKLNSDFISSLDNEARDFLKSIFGNSSYLSQIICDYPDFFQNIITKTPEIVFEEEILALSNYDVSKIDLNKIKQDLRIFKKKLSLVIALADISGFWELENVTKALTITAEKTLDTACRFLFYTSFKEGKIEEIALENSGYIIIGMGKLGAYELNYSSDIDLIILFDDKKIIYKGNLDAKAFYNNLTKSLIAIMQERTPNGYVFRTDLRLRPDPNSTPVAMSVSAAETYYESFGQNWERAAMIKARPVAGDIEAGNLFLKHIKPFVWRKSLDFKAIQDIHTIKGQILNLHSKNYKESLLGYNVKLGRGGIREIEFYAQSQQLIWGGRNPVLQNRETCKSLDILSETGHVASEASEELKACYRFLRMVEHRIQMVEDRQTHELPKNEEDFHKMALFCGFNDKEDFCNEVKNNLMTVENYFTNLFNETSEKKDVSKLVFEGNFVNSETIEKLAEMGFSNNTVIFNRISDWLAGHPRATRTAKAKELLLECLPSLLNALSDTSNPDTAFMRFDEFLYAQPAGVQLFYLFKANPSLFNLVAKIMGDAPSISKELQKKPELLDNIIEPDFFAPLPDKDVLMTEVKRLLNVVDSFEQTLDVFRRFKKYRLFQLQVQLFENIIDGETFGRECSKLADVIVSELMPQVLKEFVAKFGKITNSKLAILALGKAGSEEMGPKSDLDLIVIYETDDINSASEGGNISLAASNYFTKWTMRFTNALNVMTAEGKLWDIDMRLRPSGNAGPLATSLEAFVKYQTNDAWIWEHQALTRARVICGDQELIDKINQSIKTILSQPRDKTELVSKIDGMRLKIAETHKPNPPFGIKYMPGGMVDIEFIVQYLKLAYGADYPEILIPKTSEALIAMSKSSIISNETSVLLNDAYSFWLSIQGILSLTVDGDTDENNFSKGLKEKLSLIVSKKATFEDLRSQIKTLSEEIVKIYKNFLKN